MGFSVCAEHISSMRSLRRALLILSSFSADELELSVSEISYRTGIPKPTVHRIITPLVEFGFLYKNSKRGKYLIGPSLLSLGSLYLRKVNITKAADSVIKMLNELTGETITVTILDKGNILVVMKEESKHELRIASSIGSSRPAYATASGKALLSELTDEEIDTLFHEERLEPITQKTIKTKTELKRELENINKSGISLDSEGGYEGVEGIGSVIRDANGKAVAAMSIAVPVFRIHQAYRKRLEMLVRLGTSLVSYRLGYQGKDYIVRDIEEIRLWWEQNKSGL